MHWKWNRGTTTCSIPSTERSKTLVLLSAKGTFSPPPRRARIPRQNLSRFCDTRIYSGVKRKKHTEVVAVNTSWALRSFRLSRSFGEASEWSGYVTMSASTGAIVWLCDQKQDRASTYDPKSRFSHRTSTSNSLRRICQCIRRPFVLEISRSHRKNARSQNTVNCVLQIQGWSVQITRRTAEYLSSETEWFFSSELSDWEQNPIYARFPSG